MNRRENGATGFGCAGVWGAAIRVGLDPGRRALGALAVLAVLTTGALIPTLADAQTVAVPFSTNVQFLNTSQVASFVVDLGSLPLRPELVVDATPTGLHADMQLQIEITDFQWILAAGGQEFCPQPTEFFRSTSGPGPAQLTWATWTCEPRPGQLAGDTARVNVRVLSFGTTAAPANVTIAITGITQVPTSTQLVPYRAPGQQYSATLLPSKDTTIYERSPAGSNGAGQFLWAGRDVNTTSPFTPFRVRSLLAFNLRSGLVPTNASITNVELRLDVESILGSGNSVSVYSVDFGRLWAEGDADASGSELAAGASVNSAATWTHRLSAGVDPEDAWFNPGGDPFDLLTTQAITTTGIKSFSSTALRTYVEELHQNSSTSGDRPDGFLLRGPESSAATSGVQIASSESVAVGANRPELVVTFIQPAGSQESTDQTGVVTFINEGQNLRWIYDLDQDDVYATPVGGVCTVLNTNGSTMPYSYAFTGTPGYTGHDCCTWHLDSQSGTVGTGQLIFYHNLDPNNPANLPPDTDTDGIKNLCDNCPNKPNGPLRGSCLGGSRATALCRSNLDCPSSTCSLSQEDANGDKTGDACVPEPAATPLLAAGLLGLAQLARARGGCRRSPGRGGSGRMRFASGESD